MNERNVTALEALIAEAPVAVEVTTQGTRTAMRLRLLREAAAFLASRGVLVPASLTDEECDRSVAAGTEYYEGYRLESEFRAALERIAKGE